MSRVLAALGPVVENHAVLSIFFFLLLFGFMLPITEEIALALTGVYIRGVGTNFLVAWGVGLLALVLADVIYFLIARYFGPRLLRFKWVARFVKPEKVYAGERYFLRRGPRIVFFCRFVVGLRMPGILGAGLLRMDLRKFVAYDGLAILLVTPVWLGVGWALGAQFDAKTDWISRIIAIATPLIVLAGAFLVYRSVRADRAKSETEAEPQGEVSE